MPDRTFRDAAEVGIAFGETKSARPPRGAKEAEAEEPPSRRGRRAAASESVSAAAATKLLGGIDFPRSKNELVDYANAHRDRVADGDDVVAVVAQLPERRYRTMADVELEFGHIAGTARH